MESCNVAPLIVSSALRGETGLKGYTECCSKYMDCINLYGVSTILIILIEFVGIRIRSKGMEIFAISFCLDFQGNKE